MNYFNINNNLNADHTYYYLENKESQESQQPDDINQVTASVFENITDSKKRKTPDSEDNELKLLSKKVKTSLGSERASRDNKPVEVKKVAELAAEYLDPTNVLKKEKDSASSAAAMTYKIFEEIKKMNTPEELDCLFFSIVSRYGNPAGIEVIRQIAFLDGVQMLNRLNILGAGAVLGLGYVSCVEELCAFGVDINTVDGDGYTHMHKAAKYGQPEVIEILKKFGADINAKANDKTTPLHVAAEYGQVDAIRVLCASGADIEAVASKKNTAMHIAAKAGKLEAISVLCKSGANINVINRDENTPMHVAAKAGKLEVIKSLCNFGADTNARNEFGATPMHLASSKGRLDIVKTLHEFGANINALTDDDETVLYFAVLSQLMRPHQVKEKLIVKLCEWGVDTNVHTCFNNDSALTIMKDNEIMHPLLDRISYIVSTASASLL